MSNAGQAVSGIAGGIIGFAIGGPAGAIYGVQAGLLVGSILSPTQLPGITGPRIEDFEKLEADPGAPILKGWGRYVVPGFRMYLGPVTTLTNEEDVGGKGAPEQTLTTFTYLQTLALGLGEGPILGVGRIWENGELVYDLRGQLEGESDAEYDARIELSTAYDETFTLYLGSDSQDPDPTLELEQGTGNVPAFLDVAYMVFPDRQLKETQGNRHPVFKIEILENSAQTPAQTFDFTGGALANWTEHGTMTALVEVDDGLQNMQVFAGNVPGLWSNDSVSLGIVYDNVFAKVTQIRIDAHSAGFGRFGVALLDDSASATYPAHLCALVNCASTTADWVLEVFWDYSGNDAPEAPTNYPGDVTLTGADKTEGVPHTIELRIIGEVVSVYFNDTLRMQFDLTTTEMAALSGLNRVAWMPPNGNQNVNQMILQTLEIGGFPVARATTTTAAEIVTDVCARAGISNIDVSDLESVRIDGYALTRLMSARSAIDPLRMVGLFDIVESGETLRFPTRGKATVATLTEADLGAFQRDAGEIPPLVTTVKAQDYELPRQIRLRYISYARDYETGEQLSPSRFTTESINEVTIDVPVIMSDERAAQIAEIVHRDAWAARWQNQFTLDLSNAALEPADAVVLPIDGRSYRVRIVAITEAGLIMRRCEAVRDDDGAYVSTALATAPVRPTSIIELIGDTELTLLDLPALQETHSDAGFYVVARRTGVGAGWSGARIHRSVDGGSTFTQVSAVTAQAVVGTVVTAPEGQASTWNDEAELIVDVLSGSLASRTDTAVLAGANAVAIGDHGRWLICQFANQELVSTGRYRLTRLLLGRRGTESYVGTVQAGDKFVLISGAGVYRLQLQNSEIGVARTYRGVTIGAGFDTGDDVVFTGRGQALKPFSPVYVRTVIEDNDDITISWLRRDRLAQTMASGIPLPLSEASESYQVAIINDGYAEIRVISTTENQATYTAAQQTTDFGSPQTEIGFRVYQMSAIVGRGEPHELLPASLSVPSFSEYGEWLARPFQEGAYIYAHRAINEVGGGNTAILQLNRADLSATGNLVSFADAVYFMHPYDGELWVIGYDGVSGDGLLWRVPYDSAGFDTPIETALDVDISTYVAGLEGELYAIRMSSGPTEYKLIRIDLSGSEPVIVDEVLVDSDIIAVAVSDAAVFTHGGTSGEISKYSRDLTFDSSVTAPGSLGFERGLLWNEALSTLFVLWDNGIRAYNASLSMQWEVLFVGIGMQFLYSRPTNTHGINLAVDIGRGEVLIAVTETEGSTEIVLRLNAATGAVEGRYPIPAYQVVASSGNLFLNYGAVVDTVEIYRFRRYSASYLATIEVDEP